MLPEVLLVVSGEVHKVHQQERLHHGERTSCEKQPLILTISVSFSTLNMIKFVLLSLHNLSSISLESENHSVFFVCLFVLSDCHLWEKLLCLSQKCFSAAHEKCDKVCVVVISTVKGLCLVLHAYSSCNACTEHECICTCLRD